MRPLHYLDTARLGQMTPAAKDAQLDFVRLSAEEPSSLYFEQFLRDGFSAWPAAYQERFPGLRTWTGVSGLKQSIRRLTHAPDDWQVLFANRSLSLIHLATRCLFRACRNVMVTDLSWPTYLHAIEHQASRTGNRVTTAAIRTNILQAGWSSTEVAACLAEAFTRNQCDSLFLPAVDHLGIRLPIREIIERIQRGNELRFSLIDAAQAFCHVPLDDCLSCADFIVAGSHKWMGAYLPTGIGLFGKRRSREMIRHRLRHLGGTHAIEDPLLQFTEQIESGRLDGHSETANLTSLFACAGAAADLLSTRQTRDENELPRINDLIQTMRMPSADWQPVLPADSLRTRIVLFESHVPSTQHQCVDAIRQTWLDAGYVITAYPGARVRASMPNMEPHTAD